MAGGSENRCVHCGKDSLICALGGLCEGFKAERNREDKRLRPAKKEKPQ